MRRNEISLKLARIAWIVLSLVLFAFGFMGMASRIFHENVAGFAVVLLLILLFFNSFYLSLSVPEAQTRGAKILRFLRAGLHHVFCYLAVPASVLVLFIESERHEAFPSAVDALIGVGVFCSVCRWLFSCGRKNPASSCQGICS
jgi:hypothetical protein